MRLLVVLCLVFVVVQAETVERVNAGAQLFGRYLMMTLGRSNVRSRGTECICQSGQAVERDDVDELDKASA